MPSSCTLVHLNETKNLCTKSWTTATVVHDPVQKISTEKFPSAYCGMGRLSWLVSYSTIALRYKSGPNCSFSGWGQFLQSFCRSTSEFVISRVAKPFSNSKTISLYIKYKNSRFNNQKFIILSIKYECALKNSSNHRVVIRKNPLQITSDHFRMTTL